jgi:hypothetical protein
MVEAVPRDMPVNAGTAPGARCGTGERGARHGAEANGRTGVHASHMAASNAGTAATEAPTTAMAATAKSATAMPAATAAMAAATTAAVAGKDFSWS